jgi:glycosyltransferase involved in cell wall biosynthesis
MSQFKVLFVSHQFPATRNIRSGIFNKNRSESLANKNLDVIVFIPTKINPRLDLFYPLPKLKAIFNDVKLKLSSKIFAINNVQVIQKKYFAFNQKFFPRLNAELVYFLIKPIIRKFKPDLIILSELKVNYLVFTSHAAFQDIPIYIIAEGSDVLQHLKTKLIIKFNNRLFERNDSIIAVSDYFAEIIKTKLKFINVIQINNGFDHLMFKYRPHITKKEAPIKLISVGRLEKVKGYDLLINALKEYTEPFELKIIGSGSQKSALTELIEISGLKGKVHLINDILHAQIPEELAWADFFIMPSYYESFCIAALEAMGIGLPVIGSDVGGLKSLIIPGFNGFRFKVGDKQDFLTNLNLIIKKDWERETISAWAHDNYSWNKWADQVLSNFKMISNKILDQF